VPGKKAPERYPSEDRVCNLSLGALQWSTANVAADLKEPQYRLVDDSVRLTGPLFGPATKAAFPVPFQPRPHLGGPGAEILTRMGIGKAPRDIVVPFGSSQVLYVNGSLAEITTEEYWLPVLARWGKVDFHRFAVGEHCMATRLHVGDTEFVVTFNEEITEPREIAMSLPAKAVPLSEAAVLHRDGGAYEPLPVTSDQAGYKAHDRLGYYAVYQFAFSPVKIQTPELVLQPGQSSAFSCEVTNLTDSPVRGRVGAASVIPTISGDPVEIELNARETKKVLLTIHAAPTVDWGKKTIYFELTFAGRRAVVLRELVVQKPTEVELAGVIVQPGDPQVELHVPANPYGQTAPLTGARLTFGGQTIELPEIREGASSKISLPPLDVRSAPQPTWEVEKLRIDLGLPGARRTVEREVFVRRTPKAYPRQSDATAVLVVSNARSNPLEQEPMTIALPKGFGPCGVRSQEGKPVPSQVDASGRLRFAATAPARSAEMFYVGPPEGEVATDLECTAANLGTGTGTLEVTNSHLSVVLSEQAGGTVTRLRSEKTDRDYGRNSFGVNYGAFSRYDPTKPPTNTVEYIHESKTRQEDSPGRIEVLSKGPAAVVARVRWADERVQVDQTYEFPAYKPYFIIRQRVKPIDLGGQQELVGLDAQFQPHRLTKSFPNFVGVVSGNEQPHFGWRTGAWVPDYATLMAPNEFDESISLVITRSRGLTGIRQGFWPAERPKPGKCEIARMELLADPATGCQLDAYVLVHQGHQIVAKRLLADLRTPPHVELIETPQWSD
ncbi:MAG: hypothetical protein ABIP48_07240, partial [Planctomycetota bacterium]